MKNERRPYILFADDDNATLQRFTRKIELLNWAADYVRTAAQIIAKVNEVGAGPGPFYDALVCDINYFKDSREPMISGVAAARAVRESHPDLPVIFVSSYSSYFIKDEIGKLGGELFTKPFSMETLFERISYLVKWHWAVIGATDHKPERRRAGVNTSGQVRRATDRQPDNVSIPAVLQSAVAEIRETRRELLKTIGH